MTKENNEVSDAIINAIASHLVESKKQGLEITPYRLKRLIATHVDDISEYPGNVNELYSAIFERLTTELVEQFKQDDFKIPATVYPENQVIIKDKVTTNLFRGIFDDEPFKVTTGGRNQDVYAMVSIDFDELNGIRTSRQLKPEDRLVYEAITSLYVDGGNEYVTLESIYKTMRANVTGGISEVALKEVADSLELCASTRVHINAENEMNQKKWNITNPVYKGNLLYIESVQFENKGKTEERIRILQPPILYVYADAKDQIARMPMKLLNTPINKNKEILNIQAYLYREILWMKNGTRKKRNGERNNDILLSNIYELIENPGSTPASQRKKQAKIRKQIKEGILDHWVTGKWLSGYEEKKDGREISKLTIRL